MRVTFLTHYYPPEIGAPQARISALAAGLAARGFEVQVHAPPPHYPAGRIEAGHENRLLFSETVEGVPVWRSAVYPAPNRGFARRLANHASFGASAVVSSGRTGPADVVVAETPPLFLAGSAIAYARRKRARLVLNISDLWPRSAIELGALRSRTAIAVARTLERRAYGAAAAIACPTEGIEAELGSRPEAAGKVTRILTGVDLGRFDPTPPSPAPGLRVIYAGTVGMAQGLGTLVDAAALLPEARVRIAGDGAEAAKLRGRAATIGNIELLGRVPHEDIPRLLAEADAAVVLLRDLPVFEGAVPTKLLEGLGAGRPVVLAASGEAARLLDRSGGGMVVPPQDAAALAAALEQLAADPDAARRAGAAGRRFAERWLGMDRFVEEWADLLEGVMGARCQP